MSEIEKTEPSFKGTGSREALLHSLVKGSREYALLLLDPEEKIRYWNAGAEKILGYSEAEVLGKPIYLIFSPEDLELGVAHQEIQKAREDGWSEDERWHMRKDGTRIWASGVVTSVSDDDGELIGFSKVFRDSTMRKLTEDKLRGSVAELTQFSYAISHDLQEPLRTIASYLNLMDKKYVGKVSIEHDGYIKTARDSTKRLQALVNDLLSFVHSDRKPNRNELTDCSAVFDAAVSNLRLLVQENGAVVTRTALPVVVGDSTQLMRVFQNLISNAVKYRLPGVHPKIYATVENKGAEWVFSVCDNGIGIPASAWTTVFEPFKRLHPEDEYPGTGLGLPICRKVIEQHGGRIWIESTPHDGTKVHFTLPMKCGEQGE